SRSVKATGDVASPVHRSIRPSCSAARTGADPVPYSFASSRSLVTTSGVKRVFSSVTAPSCFGRRQSSLNKRGGRTAGAVCCGADEIAPPAPKTSSTIASNLMVVILLLPCGLLIADGLPIQAVGGAVHCAMREVHPATVTLCINLLVPHGKPGPTFTRARDVADIASVGNGNISVHFDFN